MTTPPSSPPAHGYGTPNSDVAIDQALVRALLRQQHADLADLPLQRIDAGWDNEIFRLGDALAVRLPRRAAAAKLVAHEQQWLPKIAPALPIAVPAPLRVGAPTDRYPWSWSVVPWLEGSPADLTPPAPGQAQALALFLKALHVAAPPDAPRNPVRGVPLAVRAAVAEERMARLANATDLITAPIRRTWAAALQAPMDTAGGWIHGDLHARNVLVHQGRISAIIDWGDIAAGDAATDLAAIWMLFEAQSERQATMQTYAPASEALWARAKGWAVLFGVLLADTGLVDHPRHAQMGQRTLARIAADF